MAMPELCSMDILETLAQKTIYISVEGHTPQIKWTLQTQHNFLGKKEDFFPNDMNKQALITMIAGRLENKGCHVVHAEGDEDVDIVKAAITMSSFQSTTLLGEDTDLLVLLLFYAESSSHDLYFRSEKNKEKFRVYNIKILKQLFGTDICSVLLFAHAFSGSDTTSRIFGNISLS